MILDPGWDGRAGRQVICALGVRAFSELLLCAARAASSTENGSAGEVVGRARAKEWSSRT